MSMEHFFKLSPVKNHTVMVSISFQNMHTNYSEWMRNTLIQEVDDWQKEEDPEVDSDSCFHTSAPIIIYQMIDENLQVAATISPELVNKVLTLSMGEICSYGAKY